jgi:hypothetical protein
VSRWVVTCANEHSGAKKFAWMLLVKLAGHADHDGTNVWASQDTLAKEMGVGRATVQRAQAELVALSLIHVKVSAGKNGTNRYTVRLCVACIPAEKLEADRHAASCISVMHKEAVAAEQPPDGQVHLPDAAPASQRGTTHVQTHVPVRPSAKAAAVKPDGFPATLPTTAPLDALYPSTTVAFGGDEEFESREDEERIKRQRAALMLAMDSRAPPPTVDNGKSSRERTEVRVRNELDVWEEAPLPAEPLDQADEPELVTVVRAVGLDVVLTESAA